MNNDYKFDQVYAISQYKYKWITSPCFESMIISFFWFPLDISVPFRYFDLSSKCFCFENTKSLSLVITLSMEIFAFKSILSASMYQFKSFYLTKLFSEDICKRKFENLTHQLLINYNLWIKIIKSFHSLIE